MTDTELERRLRRALAARANAVTADRLTVAAASPTLSARRARPGRWWLPLPASVAAAAVVALVFAVLRLTAAPDQPTPGGPPPSAPATSISPSPSVARSSSPVPTQTSPSAETGPETPSPTGTRIPTTAPGGSPVPTQSPTTGATSG